MALNSEQEAVFRELVKAGLISNTASESVFRALFDRFVNARRNRRRDVLYDGAGLPASKNFVLVPETTHLADQGWKRYDWIDLRVHAGRTVASQTLDVSLMPSLQPSLTATAWDAADQYGYELDGIGIVIGRTVGDALLIAKQSAGIATPDRFEMLGRYA